MENKKTRKIIIGILIVVLFALIVSLLLSFNLDLSGKVVSNQPIKIGIILPLTGPNAFFGIHVKNGLEMAKQDMNINHLQLVYEDSKCNPTEGLSSYNKLTRIDNIKIITGEACSNVVLAVAPEAQKDHILFITPGAAAVKVSDIGDYIFRNHVMIKQKTALVGEYANRYNKIAVLYDSASEAFADSQQVFQDKVTNKNKITYIGTFKKGDTDFRTQIAQIKQKNPDAIYLGGYAGELASIVKQLNELQVNAQILSDDAILDPNFIKTTGELSEGIIFGTTNFSEETSPIFWNNYEQRYGEIPSIFAGQGYDTLGILNQIIKNNCKTADPACIRDELFKINYPGVTGSTRFDGKGNAIKDVVLKTVKDGQFVNLKV